MEEKNWCEETLKIVESQIGDINNSGIVASNIDYLYKLVDIHKDLSNEKYWKEKLDIMYREYNDNYGRRRRDSRGRYMTGEYGRRGMNGRYRGEDHIDDMYSNYQNYSEGRDAYGADQETLKSLEKMLKSTKDFMKMLGREAKSEEEIEMIRETAREISEM
ncbi:MAG: hypothetical protein IKY26_00240 [Erysipelotrichaceae bacterium]|nr:hypothetical protein [Erysipelotrichaceae bacterium]